MTGVNARAPLRGPGTSPRRGQGQSPCRKKEKKREGRKATTSCLERGIYCNDVFSDQTDTCVKYAASIRPSKDRSRGQEFSRWKGDETRRAIFQAVRRFSFTPIHINLHTHTHTQLQSVLQ